MTGIGTMVFAYEDENGKLNIKRMAMTVLDERGFEQEIQTFLGGARASTPRLLICSDKPLDAAPQELLSNIGGIVIALVQMGKTAQPALWQQNGVNLRCYIHEPFDFMAASREGRITFADLDGLYSPAAVSTPADSGSEAPASATPGLLKNFTRTGGISEASRDRYKDQIPANLLRIWDEHGIGYIDDGFLRIVDPVETTQKLAHVVNIVDPWVPVMTTALGDVIYIVDNKFVVVEFYRWGRIDVVSAEPDLFVSKIETMAVLDGLLRRDPYPARRQRDIPTLDQCYAFVPLLALGGPHDGSTLDLSDMWIHLSIIVQMAGRPVPTWQSSEE